MHPGNSNAGLGQTCRGAPRFGPQSRLAVIAIPKVATRAVEVFLSRHLPVWAPSGGALYTLTPPEEKKKKIAAAWPETTATLRPGPRLDDMPGRANPDLFLFHATTSEVERDWVRHRNAFRISENGHLVTTVLLRDPVARIISEFHFGRNFELGSRWSSGDAWRKQFWGQADYTDEQLAVLQVHQLPIKPSP